MSKLNANAQHDNHYNHSLMLYIIEDKNPEIFIS